MKRLVASLLLLILLVTTNTYAAFTHIASRGTNTEEASDQNLTLTYTGTIAVGRLLVIATAWDNPSDGVDGDVSFLTVSDTQSNTYIRARECQDDGTNQGAIHGGIFYTVVTTQLTNTDVVTITSSATAVTAKTVRATEFSFAGSGVTILTSDCTFTTSNVTNLSANVSGLTNGVDYLLISGCASESKVTTGTLDADYTHPGDVLTTNATDAANIRLRMGYRITNSITSDSYSCSTGATSTSHIVPLIVFQEVSSTPTNFFRRRLDW